MEAGPQIAWIVHTHEHRDHSADWYWALGLGALAIAGISVFLGNVLLAIIIAIAAGSIGTLALRGPRTHWVRVDNRGVTMDGTLYPYRSLHSFWVEPLDAEHGHYGRLLVTTTGFIAPQLVIPVEDETRAQSVRTFLKKYMPEEEQHPHLGEHVAELFGL
jgi:hypothetical protein